MKLYGVALALVGALFVWVATTAASLGKYAAGYTLPIIFAEASAIPMLIMLLSMVFMIAVVIVTLVNAVGGPRNRNGEIILRTLSILPILLGVLGGLYGEMNTRMAMAAAGVTRIDIIAPSRIEALTTVGFGAFAGFVALAGATLLYARWKRRPAAVEAG